ncbi:LacI family DNA-binding transcriptional regulator [Verminephrobacter aporrectodeae]|nr:LacI family DNA-binding transcriptional regulator [Verminephrobacter aporrectodeae]
MPTLADLAAAAGVSTMTVSRALNNQPGISPRTRDIILKVASEKGYTSNRVAQKLSSGQSRVIGVIALQLELPFIIGVVSSVVRAAAAAGNEVLIYSHPEREKQPSSSVLHLLQQFTDGAVALPPYHDGFVEALARGRFPVAMVDSPIDHADLSCVACDDYGGARSAMKHLADLGHKRIAFIDGVEKLGSAKERLRAYHEAVAVHGLARDPALLVPGHFSHAGGHAAALALLALRKRPTAIFAANDLSAFGAMAALQEQGLKIPQDMSVVGFDDAPAALHVHPALTTVRQPMEGIGRAAVSTLLSQIAGLAPDSVRVTLPTELMVRQSTAAPRD